ncbi:hypothetical protein H6F86_05405 [Phormidium sp. FACHB-592]|uniref:Uncharacterized protein n=1 Tax=Stenomitos frigidus AS-A4 TaxID=2933935 RepID=A0ABV0KTC3_9CYAN|nr:hypothetical protein [Phormidium sp. FACHB-592]MBD2073329.1 hypothetical protein [Phormidium sp. FACHB-592]
MTLLYAHRLGQFKFEPTLSSQTITAKAQVDQVTYLEKCHQQRYIPVLEHFPQTRSTYLLERRLFH